MTALEVLALTLAVYFIILFTVLMIIIKKLDKILFPQTNPKKPTNIRKWHDEYVGDCPSCNRIVRFAQKHCHNCIQLLDWSEVLELPTEEDSD